MTATSLLQSSRSWPRRVLSFLRFSLRFLHALVTANLQMARVVLFRRTSELAPGFIAYPVAGLSPAEIVILSHCITLTPGTTSVELADDRRVLVIHALDAGDPAGVCAAIKRDLEEPLLAWLR